MKYYAEHEMAYQQILKNGGLGWGNKKSIEDLLSIPYAPELDRALAQAEKPGAYALDLGCGTGPISLHLAGLGYKTLGLDISEAAILKARELASGLALNCEYACADFLSADLIPRSFDVVVDSSFLHCIVFDQDRFEVFKKVESVLKPGGLFIVHTMTSDKLFNFGADFEFDSEGILWYLAKASRVTEAKIHSQGKASPQRRILPSQKIINEIKKHGLQEIQTMSLYYGVSSSPASLFGIFKKV